MDTLNSTALMKLENWSFYDNWEDLLVDYTTLFAVFASPIVVFFNYSNSIKGLLELAASVLGKFNFSGCTHNTQAKKSTTLGRLGCVLVNPKFIVEFVWTLICYQYMLDAQLPQLSHMK